MLDEFIMLISVAQVVGDGGLEIMERDGQKTES